MEKLMKTVYVVAMAMVLGIGCKETITSESELEERSLAQCKDSVDNDEDGYMDCADW
jgi:hypothetical protein